MVFRINPNHQALWRNPFEMQLGLGQSQVVLKKLTPAQERLIAALYRGIADQQLPAITKELGLSKADSDSVLEQVGPIMLAENPKLKSKVELTQDFVAGAFAEIIRASLLHAVDGEAVLIGRAGRSIHIEDISRTGLAIAQGLAAAGVGQLISHDEQQVQRADLGPTAYPSQLLGRPRIDALRTMLAASPNKAVVSTGKKILEKQLQKIDCAVLIVQQAIEPRRYSHWANRDVPHIAVSFDTEFASVSPMIIPGQTACLFCLENMRTDQDSNWPVLASQLIGSQKKFDDAASQLFAAGVVIQKILARIDKVAGFEQSEENLSGYRMNLKTGEITEFVWPKHKACSC
jgi:molybdopterin/thiamine biosynthesis adenylyltransferase